MIFLGYIVWAIILAASVIVECTTAALVSIWFAPSAGLCIVLDLLGVNIYIQIAVFVVVTALLVFLLRNKIRASFTAKPLPQTNVDSLIGKTAFVEEDIPADGVGRVNVGGMSWSAYSAQQRTLCVGEKVTVVEVSGVKLLCEPIEKTACVTK